MFFLDAIFSCFFHTFFVLISGFNFPLTLHSLDSTFFIYMYISLSTLHTPHCTLQSTLLPHTLHFTHLIYTYTPHSTFCTPQSKANILLSTVHSQHLFRNPEFSGAITQKMQIFGFTTVFYVIAFGFVGCILFLNWPNLLEQIRQRLNETIMTMTKIWLVWTHL